MWCLVSLTFTPAASASFLLLVILLRIPAVRIFFHEGLGIGHVVLGIIRLAGAGGLDILGWHAAPYLASPNLCVLQHKGTCGNDGSFADFAAVE